MTAWVLLNGGAVAAAVATALARGATTRSTPLGLATLAGYLALVHALVLGAGLLGHLTVGGLAFLLAVGLAVALWLARRVPARRRETDPTNGLSAAGLFARLAATAAAIAWAWPHVVGATRLWIWDDYAYHMVYPTLWLREHAIGVPAPGHAFTMQAWYPLSASVVAAWFMAPWPASRGDALAWVSLTGPLYLGLVAAGAAAVLARCGCRPGAWSLPLVLLVTSPRVSVMASSFSDADLAVAATLLGAFAFAVPRREPEAARDLGTDAAYAAALSGLALGVKVSAAPVALVVLAMLVLRARHALGARRGGLARVALLVAAAWIAMGGYWYTRNVLHTGNPVYPAAFLGWSGTTFPETTLLEYARHYGARRTIADALVVYADWPRSHAVLAALGLLGLAVWLAWRRRRLPRGQRYVAAGGLAIVVAVLGLLPFAPYSAGNWMTFRSGFVHWDSMRYIALVPMLGWLALGLLVDVLAGRWRAPAVAVAVAVVLVASPGCASAWPWVLVALALVSVLLVPLAGSLARATPAPLARVAALALVLAAIVLGRHSTKAAATAEAVAREPLFGGVVATLDRQPPGSRVAVFGDPWIYPAFGARHDLDPIRLDGDGAVLDGLAGDAMGPGELTVEPQRFHANLRRAAVDVVVVVHLPHPGRSPEWPAQQTVLETMDGARLLHRDGATAVWRLSPRRRRPLSGWRGLARPDRRTPSCAASGACGARCRTGSPGAARSGCPRARGRPGSTRGGSGTAAA
jgi:hypothetical protein